MSSDATFVAASTADKPDYSPVDVSSKRFWSLTSEQRDAAFGRLRRDDPVSWQRPVQDAVVPDPFAARVLSEFPDQRSWLRADFDRRSPAAIEEIIRFASSVMTFRRTAITGTELGGKKITPGDEVVMFYSSGNRDATTFHRPERLDLSRDPNPHVGFGGGGVHFCLGHQLAKATIRELLHQLLEKIPDFETGEPELLGTNFMRGIKRLLFRFTPPASRGEPV